MSLPMHEDSLGSSSSTTNKKRSSSNTGEYLRKRRRKFDEQPAREFNHTDNSFSALSHYVESGEHSNEESITDTRPPLSPTTEENMSTNSQSVDFGRNRLLMGFAKASDRRQNSKDSGEVTGTSISDAAHGGSSASAIEISDDEMEESEGGMVINVDQYHPAARALSSDDSQSQESGEVVATPKNSSTTRKDSTELFVVDPTPSIPMKRLADLNAADLDSQLKYAFFHLDRTQIDLSRPVVCLVCSSEGHLDSDCEGKHSSIFPVPKFDPDTQVRLWISCCVCASKSHLVGDCPQIDDRHAERWSLKTLKPDQIINLSLETGTMKLEKDAENRNIRPAGLQIRGRAGLHHAGAPQSTGSSDQEDDEPFLRRPVGRKQDYSRVPPNRTDRYDQYDRYDRYDRYDPPNTRQPHRGGGEWYVTDSFGRRRSRSPDDRHNNHRPRDDFERPRSPPPYNSWRPLPKNERRDQHRGQKQSPPRRSRAPTATAKDSSTGRPGSNIQFSLPTRKGSGKQASAGPSGDSTPTSSSKTGDGHKPKRKRNQPKKGPRP